MNRKLEVPAAKLPQYQGGESGLPATRRFASTRTPEQIEGQTGWGGDGVRLWPCLVLVATSNPSPPRPSPEGEGETHAVVAI